MPNYDELAGSPKESLTESSGSSVVRNFLVPMNSRLTFAEALVGSPYPNFPQSRVVSIELQPWTDELASTGVIADPGLVTADYGSQPCLVTVKYGADYTQKAWPTEFPKPSFRAGTELRYNIRGSARFLTLPSSSLKWEDSPTAPVPADINAVKLIPLGSFQLQWDFVNDPPIDRLEEFMGQVNSDEFLGSPAETILFESYQVTESFRAAALNPHTNRVTVRVTKRAIKVMEGEVLKIYGWNHDYREAPAGWAKLVFSDDKPRYEKTAFAGMFL